jgi:phosphocarrier protein HPr
MTCATCAIVNDKGLHARAAAKLAKLATTFESSIVLSSPSEQGVNAKSIMGVLLLVAAKGTQVTVEAKGADAEEAVAAIGTLIADGFGELP